MIEPPFPADGRCVVCGTPIKTVSPYSDPDCFCKAACAKEFYGSQGLSGPPHPDNQPQT